jgi:RNA recognition motif-containing protein
MKRVYLGNLSYGLNEAELQDACAEYGTVVDVRIIQDRESGRSRGFGFVEMSTPEEASGLIEGLNEKELDGRKVIAAIAKEREKRDFSRESL